MSELDSDSGSEQEEMGQTLLEYLARVLGARGGGGERQLDPNRFTRAANTTDFERMQAASLAKSDFAGHVRRASVGFRHPSNRSLLEFGSLRDGKALTCRDQRSIHCAKLPVHHTLTLHAHGRWYGGQFSKSGKLFVGYNQDQTIWLLDYTKNWRPIRKIAARDIQWTITSCDISYDDRFVLYSTINQVMHLCNIHGDFEMHEDLNLVRRGEHPVGVWCSAFAAEGSQVVAGCTEAQLIVFDVHMKRMLSRITAHEDDINSVCVGSAEHGSNTIVTGSDDKLIKIWDKRLMGTAGDRARPVGVLPGHSEGITWVESKGDDRYILSNSKDQTAKLWDVRMAFSSAQFDELPEVRSRYEWDYRWMEYPGWGNTVAHPHDRSVMTYRGHNVRHTLIRARFSPEASTGQRYICTGSANGKVYIYDSVSGDEVAMLEGQSDRAPVRDVSWHPYDPVLASSSWDGSIFIRGSHRERRPRVLHLSTADEDGVPSAMEYSSDDDDSDEDDINTPFVRRPHSQGSDDSDDDDSYVEDQAQGGRGGGGGGGHESDNDEGDVSAMSSPGIAGGHVAASQQTSDKKRTRSP